MTRFMWVVSGAPSPPCHPAAGAVGPQGPALSALEFLPQPREGCRLRVGCRLRAGCRLRGVPAAWGAGCVWGAGRAEQWPLILEGLGHVLSPAVPWASSRGCSRVALWALRFGLASSVACAAWRGGGSHSGDQARRGTGLLR